MKKILFIALLMIAISLHGQTPQAGELMGIRAVTSSEMNAIEGPFVGSLVFNSDEGSLYQYTGTIWKNLETVSTLIDNGDGTYTYTNEDGNDISFNATPSSLSVYMGTFIVNATGNLNISGLPFKPSSITFRAKPNIDSNNLDTKGANGIDDMFGDMEGFALDDSGSITQQCIFVGGNADKNIESQSIFASNSYCIGIRYADKKGDSLGKTTASLSSFNSNGFTINVDNNDDNLLIIYHAYK